MNHNYVFACIDGSNFTEAVCDYSAWIANTLDAPLKLLHTIGQTQRPAVSDLSGAIGLGGAAGHGEPQSRRDVAHEGDLGPNTLSSDTTHIEEAPQLCRTHAATLPIE